MDSLKPSLNYCFPGTNFMRSYQRKFPQAFTIECVNDSGVMDLFIYIYIWGWVGYLPYYDVLRQLVGCHYFCLFSMLSRNHFALSIVRSKKVFYFRSFVKSCCDGILFCSPISSKRRRIRTRFVERSSTTQYCDWFTSFQSHLLTEHTSGCRQAGEK